jgi:hypothetical protein
MAGADGKTDINKIMQETQEIKYVNSSGETEYYKVKFNQDGSHTVLGVKTKNGEVKLSELNEGWQNKVDKTFTEISKQRQQIITAEKHFQKQKAEADKVAYNTKVQNEKLTAIIGTI